jgi:hypothetical protein
MESSRSLTVAATQNSHSNEEQFQNSTHNRRCLAGRFHVQSPRPLSCVHRVICSEVRRNRPLGISISEKSQPTPCEEAHRLLSRGRVLLVECKTHVRASLCEWQSLSALQTVLVSQSDEPTMATFHHRCGRLEPLRSKPRLTMVEQECSSTLFSQLGFDDFVLSLYAAHYRLLFPSELSLDHFISRLRISHRHPNATYTSQSLLPHPVPSLLPSSNTKATALQS